MGAAVPFSICPFQRSQQIDRCANLRTTGIRFGCRFFVKCGDDLACQEMRKRGVDVLLHGQHIGGLPLCAGLQTRGDLFCAIVGSEAPIHGPRIIRRKRILIWR